MNGNTPQTGSAIPWGKRDFLTGWAGICKFQNENGIAVFWHKAQSVPEIKSIFGIDVITSN